MISEEKKEAAFMEVYHLQSAARVAGALKEYPSVVQNLVWKGTVTEKLAPVAPHDIQARLDGAKLMLGTLGLAKEFRRWADKTPLPTPPKRWNILSNAAKQKLIIAATDAAHASIA